MAPRGGQALASKGIIPDTAVQGVLAAKPGAGARLGAVLLVEWHHPASGSSRSSPGVAASRVHVTTSLQPPEVCGCPGWHRTPLRIIASVGPAPVAPASPTLGFGAPAVPGAVRGLHSEGQLLQRCSWQYWDTPAPCRASKGVSVLH